MFYDPMISKLAVWGSSRMQAIERMRRALAEFQIAGELTTNLDFHRWIMTHPRFVAGEFDTNFINQEWHPGLGRGREDTDRLAAIVLAAHVAQTQSNHANGQPAVCAARPARIAMEDAWPSRCGEVTNCNPVSATIDGKEHELAIEELANAGASKLISAAKKSAPICAEPERPHFR